MKYHNPTTISWVNSFAKAQMNESFPLGLRGIEGVTLIVFLFHLVTPPCPLLSQEGDLKLVMLLMMVKHVYQ
jgi:hypothetical protein